MNICSLKTVTTLLFAGLLSATAISEELRLDAQMPSFDPARDVEPVYPQRALERKLSGFTLVEYNIGENGRTENVKIVDSEPAAVFDIASKRAILRTIYDEEDAASAAGGTFYRLYVYELDNTNANTLAKNY